MQEQPKPSKMNNLPAGMLLGAILTGLPIWAYAEKKIEQRSEITHNVGTLKAEVAALKTKAREDNATLHRRISETSAAIEAKLEAQAKNDSEARQDILGRLWTLEGTTNSMNVRLAVQEAKTPPQK